MAEANRWKIPLVLLGLTTAASAAAEDYRFQVSLDDSVIGEHSFTIRDQANSRQVDVQASFDVDVLIFNAYQYRHQATEIWQGDCLQAIDASTDDNGDEFQVSGEDQGASFTVTVNGEQQTLEQDCVMSFAYWNPAILGESQLLNSQDGRYMPVTISNLGTETVPVAGAEVSADHHRIVGDGISIDIWYRQDNQRWVRLESTVEGYTLVYELL